MKVSSITKRFIQPYYLLIKNLSKVAYTRYIFPEQGKMQKQKPTVHRFSGSLKQICHSSSPLKTLNSLAISFTRIPSKTGVASFHNSDKRYNGPVARYPGYPGMKFIPTLPYVSNWRWYAVTKKPTETGDSKATVNDLDKLGTPSKGSLFHKAKKPRGLEEIKRMLRERSLLKDTRDNDKKT